MKLNREQISKYPGSESPSSYESFLSIIGFSNEYSKGKWTLNEETGLVDIEGDFNCSCKGLTDFKGVKFGVVTGNFRCDNNMLTSIEGAPQKVGGDFWCHNNKLTSLVGAPQKVQNFYCPGNKLTSLVGAPQNVGRDFDCSHNSLTSLEGAPKKVGRHFWCGYNKLTSLEGAPQEVGWSFACWNNSISEKTLKLVWETMQENKIDYWTALCILNNQIPNGYWKKMSRGLDEKLSKGEQKVIYILGRFGHFH